MAHVIRGMAAGLLAGCAASWVMQAFSETKPIHEGHARPSDGAKKSSGEKKQIFAEHPDEAATATAVSISRNVFDHDLNPREKEMAGPAVHYAYGSLVGALYGGVAELLPGVTSGLGLPFGAALWFLGDEIAAPALGLAKNPTQIPPDSHADSLAAHFMYGATTDLMRRMLRHIL